MQSSTSRRGQAKIDSPHRAIGESTKLDEAPYISIYDRWRAMGMANSSSEVRSSTSAMGAAFNLDLELKPNMLVWDRSEAERTWTDISKWG